MSILRTSAGFTRANKTKEKKTAFLGVEEKTQNCSNLNFPISANFIRKSISLPQASNCIGLPSHPSIVNKYGLTPPMMAGFLELHSRISSWV